MSKSFILGSLFLMTLNVSAGDVPALSPLEEFPGGSGTTSDLSVQAFSHPLSGTRGKDRREFVVGNSFFQSVWVMSPASTLLRDGLGPQYNAVSCSACHFKDGRGRGLPDSDGPVDISLLFRLRVKNADGSVSEHPHYGGQFQPQGIDGVKGEGQVYVNFEDIKGQYADGSPYILKKPNYTFIQLHYGKLGDDIIASPRVGPQMIGLGLIESIRAEDILMKVDEDDRNGDGISGRANWVHSVVENKKVLGRFGWKAGKPSLLEQNAAAFNGDIGITSPLFPNEECTIVQTDCQSNMTSDDISMELLEKVTSYTQLLAVPKRRHFNSSAVVAGRKVFHQISCQSCHTPSYKTSSDAPFDVLRDQMIYPYSDFLLHDMGDLLADDKGQYKNEEEAMAREWRTPPLWGIGMIETVNGHTRLLHDGRARSIEEAILWHDGEAKGSKVKFLKLSKVDRENLIEFLKSL